MAFGWRANDDPKLNAGLVAMCFFCGSGPVLLRNPMFCDFSGGGGQTHVPPPPSGSEHTCFTSRCFLLILNEMQGKNDTNHFLTVPYHAFDMIEKQVSCAFSKKNPGSKKKTNFLAL